MQNYLETMLQKKKNFIFLGEAGSGKSEIAVNFAMEFARGGVKNIHFFDLDQTKPLFRSRDICGKLEDAGIPMASAEVTMIPQTWVELTDETAIKNLQKTLDLLDEDDDVQAVYHNWEE